MKNKKFFVSLVAGVMAVVMLLTLIVSLIPTRVHAASSSELKSQLNQLQDQKDELENKMGALEQKKKENLNKMEDIVSQKDTIDQQVSLLHAQVQNINDQVTAYGQLIADKQDELDQAESRLEELNEKNKSRIRAMEENGPLSYWSVLFKASSFSDFLDRLSMIEEIASADQRRLDEMSRVAEQVSHAKEDLAAEKEELEAAQLELKESEKELDAKRAEADKLLTELIGRGEEFKAYLDEMRAEVGSLDEDIAAKEQAYNEAKKKEEEAAKPKPPPANNGGGGGGAFIGGDWIIPVDYIYVSSPYGWRVHPITGAKRFHSGIDLAAYQGNPIRASRGGVVTTATYGSASGNYVTINHGDGFSSSYLHMNNYIVSPGQTVSQGEVIGYVGSTGASTGPHLHFTIYLNGATVDPAQYVKFY